MRWVDVVSPTEEDLTWLQDTFGFHPLTIEDCRQFNQRAKVEEYDEYLFISTAFATDHTDAEIHADEVQAFLGRSYVVTVHRDPLTRLDGLRQRFIGEGQAWTPAFLLAMIYTHLAETYFPILEAIDDRIDELEDAILTNPTQETLTGIFTLKQKLIYLRRLAGPERDVFNALSSRRYDLIDPAASFYYRDIHDTMVRMFEIIETSRDLLSNTLDAYLSTISNRLNEVMKRLTLIATIFMPLSFLAGLGGMNFQIIPFDKAWAAIAMFLIMILSTAALVLWFRRSQWM
jgi:magnesium transporter